MKRNNDSDVQQIVTRHRAVRIKSGGSIMKKLYVIIIMTILALGVLGVWIFTSNDRSETNVLEIQDLSQLSEPGFLATQDVSQIESVPITGNKDLGKNPASNSYGVVGRLVYPLKDIDISDHDEVIIIIRPSDAIGTEKQDAYIAYHTNKAQKSKDELYYFQASKGTTPVFYISIYKNGMAIIEETGILGAHFSQLADEFKPIRIAD